MSSPIQQQIVISGVGGQGVLFATRLLAEAAMMRNLPVFTSETHGMAQRGGTVVSHLKVGDFSSPLIRRGKADGLLALKPENVAGGHGSYLKPGGWAVINLEGPYSHDLAGPVYEVDADGLAERHGNSRAANLILLGFALARIGDDFFCGADGIRSALEKDLSGKGPLMEDALSALSTGIAAAG
jgi:indolepyruvate ferredoxin oxidoreductase, beta subunit